MPKTFRIRTTPGQDQNLHVNIEQDFDQLEILSLKLTQDDVYSKMCADYGVIVGRVVANGGFGVPNAKISVFIALDDVDENNPITSQKYPFKSIEDITDENLRYNLLPKDKQHCGHTPVGSFAPIEEVLVNEQELDIYKKYYKFTVKTNDSGDFMVWGAPLGVYNVHMDIDLSDMGCYSLSPMDFIIQGVPVEEFQSETTFAANENLDKLPQIVKQRKAVEIVPFWGDDELCSIGITRVDFDLRESGVEITPHAVFMGSSFTDAGSNAVTKRCRPRLNQGKLCELKSVPGTVEGIRFSNEIDDNNDPVLERWYAPSTEKPGKGGAFLTHIPMNLDYVTTDEFGNQIVSQDPSEGVATSGKYRFRVSPSSENGEGKQRLVGSYLIPNIRQMSNKNDNTETAYWDNPSYAFSVDWRDYLYPPAPAPAPVNNNRTVIKDMALACEDYFYHFKANRTYSVSSFMDKIKKNRHRRGFLGIKDIEPEEGEGCGGTANYFPITSAYKKSSFMIVLMQIITRMQQIIYQIFLSIIGVIILPFEAMGTWTVFKGTPFSWLIDLVVCPLKRAGRIELEAVAYPTCEKCACDEEDTTTSTPSTTQQYNWSITDGSSAVADPYNPGSICDVNWWYGGTEGAFYITRMLCKAKLINNYPSMGAGIFSNPWPRVDDVEGITAAYDPSGIPGGLGFRITSVDIGAGNVAPSNANIYAGGSDYPSWANQVTGPTFPPSSWSAKIDTATLGPGQQPADDLTETATMTIEGSDATLLDPIYQAVGAANACQGGTAYPANGLDAIVQCGSLFKDGPVGSYMPNANGMCNSADVGLGWQAGGYVYASDSDAFGPFAGTPQLYEDTMTAPFSYGYGTGGGNDGGNAGPAGSSICDFIGSGNDRPIPFFITTDQVNAPGVNTMISDGMNPDTSGQGQIVPHAMGLIFIIDSAGSSNYIAANNADDCAVYDNYYDDPGGGCDCTTQAGIGNCMTICGIECEGGECSQGTDADGCRKSCFGDPGCDDCLSTNVNNGCYVIYPGSQISKNNQLISEWRNVTNINTALCNGLMGYFFTNQWINGTLYHFQFKGKPKGSFWSGPGCRATRSGVVKYQEREGIAYLSGAKYGSGANRKKWYYRSTLWDVNTVGTGGPGFWYGTSSQPDTNCTGCNENYIKFPTTIIDLGPKVSWLKTICANPDLDSECFTAANAGASTHQQAASIMQGAANMRIAAGCGSGDFGGIFFNRDRHRLDGDISQAFTEQSTMGICDRKFDITSWTNRTTNDNFIFIRRSRCKY